MSAFPEFVITALVAIGEPTCVKGTIVYSPSTGATEASGSGAVAFEMDTLSTQKPEAQAPPSSCLKATQTPL